MEFEELVKKRRMVRKYLKKEVPEKIIRKILEIGQRAPSAGFTQMQEFIVVREREIKKELAKAAYYQDFIEEAPLVIVTCSNLERAFWRYGERVVNFYSITDSSFSTLLILLACTNLGLGACSVGAFDEEKVKKVLNLPENVKPVFIIPIGYPNEKPQKMKRIPLEKIIHYEKW